MSTEFDKALSIILDLEGGATITDDPNDPGGLTKWGISQRAYPALDIRSLTRQDAEAIYYRDYWLPVRADVAPWPYCLVLFDCAVNQGVNYATRASQTALGLDPDGVIGPRTLASMMKATEEHAVTLLANRLQRYMSLPGWGTYGRGWRNRLFRVALRA